MSKNVTVKFKKLHPDAVVPTKATAGAAGFDLCSTESVIIGEGVSIVGTGIAIQLPEGWEAQVRPRSGLAAKHGISVVNSPGTVDQDFTGEIKVLLSKKLGVYKIKKGDRIAQLVIAEVPTVTFVEVDEFEVTERGEGGFGSTGK